MIMTRTFITITSIHYFNSTTCTNSSSTCIYITYCDNVNSDCHEISIIINQNLSPNQQTRIRCFVTELFHPLQERTDIDNHANRPGCKGNDQNRPRRGILRLARKLIPFGRNKVDDMFNRRVDNSAPMTHPQQRMTTAHSSGSRNTTAPSASAITATASWTLMLRSPRIVAAMPLSAHPKLLKNPVLFMPTLPTLSDVANTVPELRGCRG